jgi:uncharacterized protein YqhQ
VTEALRAFGWPILRGAVTLIEAMVLGTSALSYSAEEAAREEGPRDSPAEASRKADLGDSCSSPRSRSAGLVLLLCLSS